MKTIFAILILAVALSASAQTNIATGAIGIGWPPNPASDNVTNYTLYWARNGVPVTNAIPTGTVTSAVISNVTSGTYSAFVTARASELESIPSETLTFPVPYRPTSVSNVQGSISIEVDVRFKYKSP